MKILKKVETDNWTYKCNCYRCSSELEADVKDLRYKREKKTGSDPRDPSDSYSYMADVYYVTCPVCSNQISVDEAKIPYVLKKKTQEKCTSDSGYKD